MAARTRVGLSRALVVGLARSGTSAALALRREGIEVVGVDADSDREVRRLEDAGVEIRLGVGMEFGALEGVEALVKSPGVPSSNSLVARARGAGVPVWSEVELGSRILPQRIAGVTGTNGKTTTCELLGEMVRASGWPVSVVGNVGRPLTSVDPDTDPDSWIVCELSSFQLEDVDRLRARVAVLLNVTPDHLDRYTGFEQYRQAKLRIFENQLGDDVAIVPRCTGEIPGRGRRVEFGRDTALPGEPRIPGPHNRDNAAAATLAARAMGVPDEAVCAALESFPGLPHRLEEIDVVAGVRYINDSKATNPEAAERALEAFPGSLVILGGSLKGSTFEELAQTARASSVRCAYLVGEASESIGAALEREAVPFERAGDLQAAVAAAAAAASEGDVVLLSPACASFDQFRDFEHRGDAFREMVSRL